MPNVGVVGNQVNVVNTQTSNKVKKQAITLGILATAIPVNMLLIKKISEENKKIPFEEIKNVCEYMYNSYNLAKKDFKYIFWTKGSSKAVKTDGKDITKNIDKQLKNSAFFSPQNNLAITLKENAFDMIHEIGHAISFNKFGKFWTNSIKKLPYLTILLPLIAIAPTKLTQKNPKLEKIKEKADSNAGKIFMASFAPWLIEEILASSRAIKNTKKIAPNLLKPSYKYYPLAFLSQALLIVCGAISVDILPKLIRSYQKQT